MSFNNSSKQNTTGSIVLPKRVWDLPPIQWVSENNIVGKYFNMFLNDITFRGRLSLLQGMGANIVVFIYKLILGIIYSSMWFYTEAAYYFFLLMIRGILVTQSRKASLIKSDMLERQKLEWKGYQFAGFLMLFLNGVIYSMVIAIAFGGQRFYYPGHTIYLFSIIWFYNMFWAVNAMHKTRRYGHPALLASKAVNFCGAMMGTYALIATIVAQFNFGYFIQGSTFVIILGISMTFIEMSMALFMVINGTAKRVRLSKKS